MQLATTDRVEQLLASLEARFEQNDLNGFEAELQTLFDIAQDCTRVRERREKERRRTNTLTYLQDGPMPL